MLRRIALLTLIAAGLISCSDEGSSSDEGTAGDDGKSGDIRASEVWKDGVKLTGVVRIYEGATVEIEPGAKIDCTEAAQIQVGGTLRVKATAEHATISCPRWRGIVVAQNGQLDIDGLDLENAEYAIETTKGAGAVNVTDSSLLAAVHPFTVGPESKLSLTRVKATASTRLLEGESSVSEVRGVLVAKYLEYNSNTNEGIMLKEGGEADIEDSVLEGKAEDLVSSYGGKSLKLRYSTLRGAHCGPHLQAIGTTEIDHITSEGNLFAITIYGASVEGPHVIKDSNFIGVTAWLDLQGDHGPLAFENVYVEGSEVILNTAPPATLTKAPARIEGAGPRPPK